MRVNRNIIVKKDPITIKIPTLRFKKHSPQGTFLDALAYTLFLGLFVSVCLGIFGVFTYIQTSPAESKRLQDRCDIIAGDKPHYVTKITEPMKHNMVCVYGPEWKKIDI